MFCLQRLKTELLRFRLHICVASKRFCIIEKSMEILASLVLIYTEYSTNGLIEYVNVLPVKDVKDAVSKVADFLDSEGLYAWKKEIKDALTSENTYFYKPTQTCEFRLTLEVTKLLKSHQDVTNHQKKVKKVINESKNFELSPTPDRFEKEIIESVFRKAKLSDSFSQIIKYVNVCIKNARKNFVDSSPDIYEAWNNKIQYLIDSDAAILDELLLLADHKPSDIFDSQKPATAQVPSSLGPATQVSSSCNPSAFEISSIRRPINQKFTWSNFMDILWNLEQIQRAMLISEKGQKCFHSPEHLKDMSLDDTDEIMVEMIKRFDWVVENEEIIFSEGGKKKLRDNIKFVIKKIGEIKSFARNAIISIMRGEI